jgi:hypothetical protein
LDVAALARQGDEVGVRGLVGYWCGEERWEGELEEGATVGNEKRSSLHRVDKTLGIE